MEESGYQHGGGAAVPSLIKMEEEADAIVEEMMVDDAHVEARYDEAFEAEPNMLSKVFQVEPSQHAVILNWGRYAGVKREPGLHCSNPCGRSIINISTKRQAVDLANTKVIDRRGNPLIVSGVVTYYWRNTVRTALEVENAPHFVRSQATAVMKQVVSRYPYESTEGACLKTESAEIGEQLVMILQRLVAASGAHIQSFEFNEISYAPEIAEGMLKRQQASAIVQARETIVEGAVDIADTAVKELQAKGIAMTSQQQAQLVGNLLTITCTETPLTPTLDMSYSAQ